MATLSSRLRLRRGKALVGVLAAVTLALTACGGDSDSSASGSGDGGSGSNGGTVEKVGSLKFATSLDPGYAHFVVATDGGFMEKHGIDASYNQFQDGNSAMDAVLTGDADISGTTELGAVSRLAKGGTLYVAGYGNEYGQLIGMVGNKSIQSPQDLVGKKIGYVPSSGGHYFLARYLDHHGIDVEDINLVPIQAPESVAALERGDVDAISLWQPWLGQAVEQIDDAHQIAWSGDDNVYMGHVFYYAGQKFVDDEKLAGAFFKAIVEAEKFIETNRAEAVEMVAKAFNLSVEETDQLMSRINYGTKYPKEMKTWFEEAAEFMVANGVIDKAPDYSTFFRPDLLASVHPELSCGEDC